MLDAAPQLRRAGAVLAAPDDLAFRPHQLRAARRALRRHLPRLAAARPVGIDDLDDLRDDVAALFDHHAIADADVLAGDLVGVVQRGVRDRGAGQQHRLEHRHRRHRAGPSDVDGDVLQRGRLLLRRETCRRSPSAGTSRWRRADRGAASASTLMTTPSVSNSRSWRVSCHRAHQPTSSSAPLRRVQCGSTGQPPVRPASRACRRGFRAPACRRPDTSTRPAGARATCRGSRFLIVPAAALRGLANSGSPASSRSRLIRANAARGQEHLAAHLDLARRRVLQASAGSRGLSGRWT